MMKTIHVVVTAAALAGLSSAISLAPRTSSPRVIELRIQRQDMSHPFDHDRQRRRRRRQTVSEVLDNQEALYSANVTLGTPAQSLRLHIDTGSSDLWTNAASANLCQQRGVHCARSGTYNADASSTYAYLNSDFNISYADGSGALGDYVTDTLHIGGHSLANFQFGVGYRSSSAQGVLGLGYPSNEVQVNRLGRQAYPNLPAAMVDAKLIQSNAYSLWLNDLDANQGQILFGGINTAKYKGDLRTVPIVREHGAYQEFIIALTGLSVNAHGSPPSTTSLASAAQLPAPVLLDSGTTLSYLPDDITVELFNSIEVVYDSSTGSAYVPCSLATNASTLDFTFSGATIQVAYNELVLDPGTTASGGPLTFSNGVPACLFGIAPTGGSTPVLGDTFLRSALVVYDLANNAISLAQTDFNSTADDVREIGVGANSVPGASAVASPVTDVVAQTGGARLGSGGSGGSGTATRPGVVGATIPTTAGATADPVPLIFATVAAVGAMVAAYT